MIPLPQANGSWSRTTGTACMPSLARPNSSHHPHALRRLRGFLVSIVLSAALCNQRSVALRKMARTKLLSGGNPQRGD